MQHGWSGGALLSSAVVATCVTLFLYWIGDIWDSMSSWFIADFSGQMKDLGIDQSQIPYYLRLWGLAMFLNLLIFGIFFGMYPVALFLAYLIYWSPSFLLELQIARRKSLLRDQMVGATVALSNATRAGLAFAQGLEQIAGETPEPLATEFRRITSDFNSGRPLAESIAETKKRLNIDSFSLFASAILVCLDRGGKITESLERISHSLQEHQRIERKIEVDTASGTKVVIMLTFFPFIFLAIFYFLEPDGTGMIFSTFIGNLVLVTVMFLVYVSARWAKRILEIDI